MELFKEFEQFITSACCPPQVKIQFFRAKQRYEQGTTHLEPVSKMEIAKVHERDAEPNLTEAIQLASVLAFSRPDIDDDDIDFDYGLSYDWSTRHIQIDPLTLEYLCTWQEKVQNFDSTKPNLPPKKITERNGKVIMEDFKLEDLTSNQSEVAFAVLSTVRDFIMEREEKEIKKNSKTRNVSLKILQPGVV